MTRAQLKPALILAVGVTLGTLVILHTRGLNGPWYWRWRWQRIDAFRLYPAMLLAAAPFFLGQWVHARRRRTAAGLALVMLSTFGLELASIGMQMDPFNLDRIAWVIENPFATSYFLDACELVAADPHASFRTWMATYPQLIADFHLHTRFKPPGLLLYHVAFVELLGANRVAALVAGLVLGVLATGSVAATYLLLRQLCGDAEAAFCGASFFALCPSLVLFFPQFDQLYPIVACAMIGLWAVALARGSDRYAVGFGLVLALALFLSYIFLVLGVFLGGLALLRVADRGRRGLAGAARRGAVALTTVATAYALFWWASGFDPIATYRAAARLQVEGQQLLNRPYPLHVVFDILDFALGSGWISYLLVAYFLLGRPDPSPLAPTRRRLVLLGFLQVLVVAVLGLLPGESARLWMLMYPLLMIPIGLELAGWGLWPRLAVYAVVWFLTTAVGQNMAFILRVKK